MFKGRILFSQITGKAEKRETFEDGFAHHTTIYPEGCGSYKPGDRRTKQRQHDMEPLF